MVTSRGNEAELRRLLESAVATVDPPTADLVSAGLAHGRRLRRERSILMIAMATVSLVAAAGVVTLALSNVSGRARTVGPATTETPATVTAGPLDSRSAVAILASLLPSDGIVSGFGGSGELGQIPDQFVYGSLTYDDGHGATETAVSVSFVPDGYVPCGEPADPACEMTTLPDGSVLETGEGQELAMPGQDPQEWEWPGMQWGVKLVRPDGLSILIIQFNSVETDGKFGQPTRPDPSLATGEMVAIVRSPLWQETVPASIVEAGRQLEPFQDPAVSDDTPSAPSRFPG